jgi:uncharacterized protein YjbI with pentapeptide repeats
MKKNLFQIVIVFVTILVLSTTVMARGKKHYRWWNPFANLWSTIETLQEDIAVINDKITNTLASTNKQDLDDQSNDTSFASDVLPIICPGCIFPKGIFSDNTDLYKRLPGAYMPGSYMFGTDLSGADLSGADLRGTTFVHTNFSNADLIDVKLSPPITRKYSNSELVIVTTFTEPNLTGADLTGTDLTDVAGLDTAIWGNTTCPDGENSDDHGGTCEGHLKP